MSIKSFTLVAAAFTSSLAFASVATADSYFAAGHANQSGPELQTALVVAEAAGTVSFYENNNGVQGRLIDTQRVDAGPNYNVDVRIGFDQFESVIAVLEVDGQPVATKVYNVIQ